MIGRWPDGSGLELVLDQCLVRIEAGERQTDVLSGFDRGLREMLRPLVDEACELGQVLDVSPPAALFAKLEAEFAKPPRHGPMLPWIRGIATALVIVAALALTWQRRYAPSDATAPTPPAAPREMTVEPGRPPAPARSPDAVPSAGPAQLPEATPAPSPTSSRRERSEGGSSSWTPVAVVPAYSDVLVHGGVKATAERWQEDPTMAPLSTVPPLSTMGVPEVSPSATASATSTLTPIPQAPATSTPEPTASPSGTPSPTMPPPTSTPSPTPTETPQATGTATARPPTDEATSTPRVRAQRTPTEPGPTGSPPSGGGTTATPPNRP